MDKQNQLCLPLSKPAKFMVQLASILLMLSIAMYGLVYATLTSEILGRINGQAYIGLFTILGAVGVSIMTPIGGKLGDLFGKKIVVIISGFICIIAGLLIPFIKSVSLVLILRFIISISQGCFLAAPYIIMGIINEPKDRPKAMGYLATAVAIGGVGGSIISGYLTKQGYMDIGIIMPTIPLVLAIILLWLAFPKDETKKQVVIDFKGISVFAIMLLSLLLSLNFLSMIGFNFIILLGILLSIILFFVFIYIEKNSNEPFIPLRLFKNKSYCLFLLIGFICYFYQVAINVYAPISVTAIMRKSTDIAGSLQFPRAILTIILPSLFGIWISKKAARFWQSMFLATFLAAIPMLVLSFTNANTSVLIYIVAITITGIAESFRSVSVTPAAQSTLAKEDMGVGTSLTNFFNSMSSTVASTVFAIIYNLSTVNDPLNVSKINHGINTIFISAFIVSIIGSVIVLLYIRKIIDKK